MSAVPDKRKLKSHVLEDGSAHLSQDSRHLKVPECSVNECLQRHPSRTSDGTRGEDQR